MDSLHFYEIYASAIVSKYIGETEENLAKIFAAVERREGIRRTRSSAGAPRCANSATAPRT